MSDTLWEAEAGSNERHLFLRDPDGGWQAWITSDGCVEYDRFFSVTGRRKAIHEIDHGHIHICNIDEEIERLQALRGVAIAHFRKYKQPWPDW